MILLVRSFEARRCLENFRYTCFRIYIFLISFAIEQEDANSLLRLLDSFFAQFGVSGGFQLIQPGDCIMSVNGAASYSRMQKD